MTLNWVRKSQFAFDGADELKLAAACALGIFGFVTDHGARKLWRQRCMLGLLTRFGRQDWRVYRFQLCFNSRDVGVYQAFKKTARLRPAKSSTQPRKAKTWCALKNLSGHQF